MVCLYLAIEANTNSTITTITGEATIIYSTMIIAIKMLVVVTIIITDNAINFPSIENIVVIYKVVPYVIREDFSFQGISFI
jgi:hypothetical protein